MEIVIMILKIIGILIGLYVLEVAIATFIPGMSVPKQPLKKAEHMPEKLEAKPPLSRKDVTFQVKGTIISAWL